MDSIFVEAAYIALFSITGAIVFIIAFGYWYEHHNW